MSKGTFRRTLEILTPEERRRSVRVFLVMAVAAVVQAIGIVSVHPFLNIVMDRSVIRSNPWLDWVYTTLGFTSTQSFLVFAGLGVLLLLLATNGMKALSDWIQFRFAHDVKHNLSVRLMERYLGRPYEFYLGTNTSELSKNVLDESGRVVSGIVKPALTFCSRVAVAIAILAMLLIIDPIVTISVIGFIGGAYTLIYLKIRNTQREIGAQSVAANKDRFQATSEAFGGFKELKVLAREQEFLDKLVSPSRTYETNQAKHNIVAKLPRYLIQSLAFGGMMALLVALIASGADVTQIVPLLGVFAFAGYRLLPAFQSIMQAMAQFRYFDEALDSIHEVLVKNPLPRDRELRSPSEIEPLSFEDSIGLEDVTFTYSGGDGPVLEDISLTIDKDTSVAFVGATGAGKTTLVDILLGLLNPDGGSLVIDGESVEAGAIDRWQRNIGYVPQGIFLSDNTIRANIAYGVPKDEIDHEEVVRAAKIAHIHSFIEHETPKGYDTTVGERGVRLSGGQRQRLGIARALYHDPEVLVMDEATSDIDGKTEAQITEAIEQLAGEKTLILIAHRLSTIQHCDMIYVLEDGDVVARGTYDELIGTNKQFRAMAQALQSGAA